MTSQELIENAQGATDLAAKLVRDAPAARASAARSIAIHNAHALAAALQILADTQAENEAA